MTQGDNNSLGYRIGQALSGVISKQPVANAGHVDDEPSQAGSSSVGISTKGGFKQTQKGKPNRSYPVNVVNKAIAKMGGH